jgi:hypothetical protein
MKSRLSVVRRGRDGIGNNRCNLGVTQIANHRSYTQAAFDTNFALVPGLRNLAITAQHLNEGDSLPTVRAFDVLRFHSRMDHFATLSADFLLWSLRDSVSS